MARSINTTREVAKIIASKVAAMTVYGDRYDMDDAVRENDHGWIFDTPGAMGAWIRHEGVILGRAELARAYADGQAMAERDPARFLV